MVRLNVTPNRITAGALITALGAAVAIAAGTREGFVIGAALYALSNVLDCCDGMVARLSGNGTVLGRMVDVFADCLSAIAIYTGLGIGIVRADIPLPVSAPVLVLIAIVSYAVHAAVFDANRNRYLTRVSHQSHSIDEEINDVSAAIAGAQNGVSAFALRSIGTVYLRYMRWQVSASSGKTTALAEQRTMLRFWSLIGSTTHVTVFAVAMLLQSPLVIFTYTIVIANVFAIALLLFTRFRKRAQSHAHASSQSSDGIVAVILAAGVGSRLSPLTDNLPKPLVEVRGRPLLAWTLDALIDAGIRRIVIVVGHRCVKVEEFIDEAYGDVDIELIYNRDYRDSNNAMSLLFASQPAAGNRMLLLDGDLFFDPTLVLDAIEHQRTSIVVRFTDDLGDEEVKVSCDAAGTVREIGKEVAICDSVGESIGIAYFDPDACRQMFATLRKRTQRRYGRHEFYESSFQQLIDEGLSMDVLDSAERVCIEIDTIQDLMDAERISMPVPAYA
ncbi:MAG: NTP transferase domain-containing protein [bacterium]|nr:NTP transferase domain-containing protein [Candidatus Kapabacteria bacterium]